MNRYMNDLEKIIILNNRLSEIDDALNHNLWSRDQELSIENPSQFLLGYMNNQIDILSSKKEALVKEIERLSILS